MARFPIKFAELHNPLFVNANLGTKLDPKSRQGLKLTYDTALGALLVEYQSQATLVFDSNVASATVVNRGDIGLDDLPATPVQPAAARAIIPPTAPAPNPPMARPMSPPVHLPQPRTAQVSHPVHDAVNGPKLSSPPKYLPHSSFEIDRAARLAAEGGIIPGAAAPTKADLQAMGKLPPDPVQAPAARRGRKPKATESPEGAQ